ncbi:MAG: GrpB family protein [Chitinophagales bacterium]|nr:GrpB family protein [Chitinophagales bacterium]HNI44557.1 GrpB family protein [Chitinophagales bacterium]
MKITLSPYQDEWNTVFDQLCQQLEPILAPLSPNIAHIGSTSVIGLAAKPIIDILIGVQQPEDLDKCVEPMLRHGFIYYEKYNAIMPYRRFFVALKPELSLSFSLPKVFREYDVVPPNLSQYVLSNIHIIPKDTYHWKRHIAFRDYVRQHPNVRQQYQDLKQLLCEREWENMMEYNKAKESFILDVQEQAMTWYEAKITTNQKNIGYFSPLEK